LSARTFNRLDAREDAVHLPAVAAGEDYHVPRLLAQHALQGVRARVDLEPPARWPLYTPVEGRDAPEVRQEVGPERGVDVQWLHARSRLREELRGLERRGFVIGGPFGRS
jgi:hypothetical protein